jgi:hypothetical protein
MTTPAGASNDDEMELINAEFDSMVAGLSLDESSPRTYLDELDEIEREEAESLNSERALYSDVKAKKVPLHLKLSYFVETLKRWWNRKDRDEGEDGARL